MEINSLTNASEALKMSKDVSEVFRKYKLDCLGCKGIKEESIGMIALNNGIDLDAFLEELNSSLK